MKKTIHIEGMSCGHCVASVEKALNALAGVSNVRVDLAAKAATLEVDGATDDQLRQAVTGIGFSVSGIE